MPAEITQSQTLSKMAMDKEPFEDAFSARMVMFHSHVSSQDRKHTKSCRPQILNPQNLRFGSNRRIPVGEF